MYVTSIPRYINIIFEEIVLIHIRLLNYYKIIVVPLKMFICYFLKC
jgi:hypothetical protein